MTQDQELDNPGLSQTEPELSRMFSGGSAEPKVASPAQQSSDGEIEAMCRAMYGKHWDGPPEKMPGEVMKEVWRKLARKARDGLNEYRP